MTINFTKAIELQTIRKLKSHAKVGYQDHANGDKYCGGCSMFVPGNPPACTHVAPPISAQGYCDDFERIDPNARARAAIGKARSFIDVLKDGPPDKARNTHVEWTSGADTSGSTTGIDRNIADLSPSAEQVRQARDQKQIDAAQQRVAELQRQLSAHSQDTSEDLYWGIHRSYQLAVEDLYNLRSHLTQKALDVLHKHLSSLHAEAKADLDQLEQRITSISKNMTVGDVHATTALGNQPAKRKSKDFLTTIGEVKGGARVVAVPAVDFGKALANMHVAHRLGSPLPTMTDMISTAGLSAAEISKRTVNVLFMRHGPTKFNNVTDMSKDRVRSWNNVPLTKEGIEDAEKAGEKLKDESIGYVVSSDLGRAIQTSKIVGKAIGVKPVHEYGMRPWNLGKFTGMSTDEAHDGILHHVENPDEAVDGGESFNTFKARASQEMLNHIKKAGKKKMLVVSHHRNERLFASMMPDGTNDAKKFMKTGEDPGDFTEMEFSTDELENAIRTAKEGQGKAKVDKAGARAGDFNAFLAKLGGESSIAAPTDQINVALQLTSLDEQNARSPFPYDQYFFANLRNDQKERVLAALTDQDALPEKVVRLSDLSAVQDRIDPNKIQAMIEGLPEKRAVVVRTGPGRYCIVDGHHRLTASFLSGVKTVTVKYLDIEAYDPRVHTDNNPGSKGEPVDKSLDMEIEFDVRKTDEDQQLVFGWASVCSMDGWDGFDKQEDRIPEHELEKAGYEFSLYCRSMGHMHEQMGVGRLIESMVFTKQKQDLLGIDLGLVGLWVGFKVDDPVVWKSIKSGNLQEFSIGGKAKREEIDA